ncbi:hypothetical protein [Flavobacterium sp.]|uniref:hypothetical protein n=1 Tax=Flavobacterium sp. TaxID=239 RepID=UPI003753353A
METKTDKLITKLSQLESKLFDEHLRENQMLANRGWGHAMRNVKIGFSTRKSDALKERIKLIKLQIES